MLYIILVNSVELGDTTIINQITKGLMSGGVALAQRLMVALVVYFIGAWLIKWLKKGLEGYFSRRNVDDTAKGFLGSVVNITLKILLLLSILHIIGLPTTSFSAILAAVGVAVGLAMKNNLSNFAGGVMLLVNKPFGVGDIILAQSTDGYVQSIGILYTTLLTADNRTVYLPNGPLSSGIISNYSRQKFRRIDKSLVIKHGVSVDVVKKILDNIVRNEKRILNTPKPFVGVTSVGVLTIDITIKIWVKHEDYSDVDVLLNEITYSNFIEQGIYGIS